MSSTVENAANNEQASETKLLDLPDNMLAEIVQLLKPSNTLVCGRINQRMRRLVREWAAERYEDSTILAEAIKFNTAYILRAVLEAGADVERVCECPENVDLHGQKPLSIAIRWGGVDVLKVLIEANPMPQYTDLEESLSSYTEMLHLMLEHNAKHHQGVDISCRGGLANSKLLFSAVDNVRDNSPGSLETVKLLLQYGADPNVPSCRGMSPLALAVEEQDYNLVQLLLDNGGDATQPLHHNNQQPIGKSLLHGCCSFESHEDAVSIAKLLKQHGADPFAHTQVLLLISAVETHNSFNDEESFCFLESVGGVA